MKWGKNYLFCAKINENWKIDPKILKKHNKVYFFSFIVRKYGILLVESQKIFFLYNINNFFSK